MFSYETKAMTSVLLLEEMSIPGHFREIQRSAHCHATATAHCHVDQDTGAADKHSGFT